MHYEDLTDVDSLSRKFLAELELRPDLGAAQVSRTDRIEVVFPAQHPEVGNIHVWLDGDEVTVGIGEHFHTHFEAYLDSSIPREEGEVQAVKNALAFISDFMQGNLILEVTYRGGATVRARHENRKVSSTVRIDIRDVLNRIGRLRRKKRLYSWTGPLGSRE